MVVTNRAPLIAAILLLLLPVVYVVSYVLLVWPDGERFQLADSRSDFPTYRYGTETWAGTLFWPLEQIDRTLRPRAWSQLTAAEQVERFDREAIVVRGHGILGDTPSAGRAGRAAMNENFEVGRTVLFVIGLLVILVPGLFLGGSYWLRRIR
jgi:hypothetical protein